MSCKSRYHSESEFLLILYSLFGINFYDSFLLNCILVDNFQVGIKEIVRGDTYPKARGYWLFPFLAYRDRIILCDLFLYCGFFERDVFYN